MSEKHQGASSSEEGYEQRVAQQVRQYADPGAVHRLPAIYHFWMRNYISPRFKSATGYPDIWSLYVDKLAAGLDRRTSGTIVSLGSGDCQIEEAIAKRLVEAGYDDFRIVCTELSEPRLDRAAQRVRGTPVEGRLSFQVVDLNAWRPEESLDGVVAHHSLHHIVELEAVFDGVAEALAPAARFVSTDMIGRNGHMRWPEAEQILVKLWKIMPEHYRYHHALRQRHDDFVNWDCSRVGFEGIRAQDILKLLIERFDFEVFFAYGNLTDLFIERGYGHNLSVESEYDKAFLDFCDHINEMLVDSGVLKPTVMMASMRSKGAATGGPKCHRHWSPEFCVRPVTPEPGEPGRPGASTE